MLPPQSTNQQGMPFRLDISQQIVTSRASATILTQKPSRYRKRNCPQAPSCRKKKMGVFASDLLFAFWGLMCCLFSTLWKWVSRPLQTRARWQLTYGVRNERIAATKYLADRDYVTLLGKDWLALAWCRIAEPAGLSGAIYHLPSSAGRTTFQCKGSITSHVVNLSRSVLVSRSESPFAIPYRKPPGKRIVRHFINCGDHLNDSPSPIGCGRRDQVD